MAWGMIAESALEGLQAPQLIMRWVHILSACLAIGGPFFMRYVVGPSAKKVLEPEKAEELRARVMGRWKHIVYLLILAFLASGLYTAFIAARWSNEGWSRADRRLYHMLLGVKILLALVMFVLASALTGRSGAFEKIRRRHRMWTTIFLLLGVLVIVVAGAMRQLPLHPTVPAVAAPVVQP